MVNLNERFKIVPEQIAPYRIKGFKRHDLIKLFAQLGFMSGAEIGVAEGRFSEVICETIPNVELLMVDPWLPSNDDPRSLQIGKQLSQERMSQAIERTEKYKTTILNATSIKAVERVIDESLDFVYIDGNHLFDFVMIDLIQWSKKVKHGGIIAGHDYYRFKYGGVVPAVDCFVQVHKIYDWYLTDERTPTFFWVRP